MLPERAASPAARRPRPRESRKYDLLLRLVAARDPDSPIFKQRAVPRSTLDSWKRRPLGNVTWLHDSRNDHLTLADLAADNAKLRAKLQALRVLLRLLFAVVRALHLRFDLTRVPVAADKLRLLKAIDRARKHFPTNKLCALVGVSPARLHAWRAAPLCQLDDRASCPKVSPSQLLPAEVAQIAAYARSQELAHHSLRTLALLAQRAGHVTAGIASWYKVVRLKGIRRPRIRERDVRPQAGIRANHPNHIWHIDAMRIVLADGTRLFLQVVLDNFSRFILAWSLAPSADGAATLALLREARAHVSGAQEPSLISDDGRENLSAAHLVGHTLREHLVAQIDIIQSNSMVEAFFRTLRQFLRRQTLPNPAAVHAALAAFIHEYNEVVPKFVLGGRTSREAFEEIAPLLHDELREQRALARDERMRRNRETTCAVCPHAGPS